MNDHDNREDGSASEPQTHNIIFLPALRLDRGYQVAGVHFQPFQDGEDAPPEVLKPAVPALKKSCRDTSIGKAGPFPTALLQWSMAGGI